MITKDKLAELVKNALNAASLTGVLSDQDIKIIVEQRHHELEVLVSHPDWDVRNDTLAEIDFIVIDINNNEAFKEHLKSNLLKALKASLSETRPCWFVGASWEGKDQTQRFIDEGVWENGYDDKYFQDVKSIKPGDRIAIKSTYTRKNNLPFSNRGKNMASVMGIKATGVVTANKKDGKRVDVEWKKTFSPVKEWYFYTGRNTIWKVEPGEWMPVVFRNLCHFSIIKKTGVTHDSIFRLQQSIS